jgi:hypothetical protein
MRLRRITQHVRTQNWAAIVLDFMIVVLGILIALQISNWNEAQQARRDEQRYLDELIVNIEADLAQARAGREASLQRLAVADAILAEAAPEHTRLPFLAQIDGDLPSTEAVRDYPYALLTSYFFMVSSRNTFEELVQTGNIGIISNRSLVKDLTDYYDRMDRQRGDDDLLVDQIEGMLDWARENGVGMADRATMEETIERATSDEAFLGFVKMASFLSHWQYSRLTVIEEDAGTLLASVESEIDSR